MKMRLFACVAIAGLASGLPAAAQDTPSPEGAKSYFANLEDGAVVSSPFKVVFGLSGMGIAPAGTEKENTGHNHLLIDVPKLGEGEGGADALIYAIPSDDNHIHFGGGQTETTLELPAGKHTLQVVLGDLGHVPHSPPVMSDVITITVE